MPATRAACMQEGLWGGEFAEASKQATASVLCQPSDRDQTGEYKGRWWSGSICVCRRERFVLKNAVLLPGGRTQEILVR